MIRADLENLETGREIPLRVFVEQQPGVGCIRLTDQRLRPAQTIAEIRADMSAAGSDTACAGPTLLNVGSALSSARHPGSSCPPSRDITRGEPSAHPVSPPAPPVPVAVGVEQVLLDPFFFARPHHAGVAERRARAVRTRQRD